MGMGSVVVQDEMELEVSGEASINAAQELQEFLVPMALMALADDGAREQVESGKEAGGAVTLVVVSHRPAAPLLHRQARPRAVQRLDLALLVYAKHDSAIG